MPPEPTYSLPELARLTGRSYEFWNEECSSRRLDYLQPRGRRTMRLVELSAYESWRERAAGAPPAVSQKEVLVDRSRRAVTVVDFKA